MTLSFYGGACSFRKKSVAIGLLFFMFTAAAHAQIKPLASVFYQNQYLTNPAMAGLETGLFINLSYRKQFNTVPGAPAEQALTGSYSFGKAALGINIYNEKAGLLKRTRAVGSYAYHLPLNQGGSKLHFGLSVGVLNERIDNSAIKGDATDGNIGRFSDREAYIDGDFGLAYTSNGLTVQGAVPNLNSFLNRGKRDLVNYVTFFTAFSYKFNTGTENGAVGLEPKLCFRGIKETDDIVDGGINVTFAEERFNILGMYHSSKNATFGFGVNYKVLTITGSYSSAPSAFRGYTNGDFELGLGIKL